MKATITEKDNTRTASMPICSDGVKRITVFQTRQLDGDRQWFRPMIDCPGIMTATAEQAETMIARLQEAVRIYKQWAGE